MMKARAIGYYEKGAAAYRACQSDPRFGYFMYLPTRFTLESAAESQVCVLVHGSARTPHTYRDRFIDFAEQHNCVIVAPMFPIGITDPEDESSYKFLKADSLRYDLVLLSMLDEIQARYGVSTRNFMLHGFSGGGHFVHRFFYLHANRVSALSVGAPGMITLLNPDIDWHCGIGGMENMFKLPIVWDDMRSTPVQMIVGSEDTETWEITVEPGNRYWMPGVNDCGTTRIDRLTTLRRSFEAAGIPVQFDLVPGVGHKGYDILGPVKSFFATHAGAGS